jgi:hypothetical protein
LKVTVTAAKAGTVAAALRTGRRVVARRSRPLAAQQSTVLTLKPSRRRAALVRRSRTLRLRVKVGTHVHAQTLTLRR